MFIYTENYIESHKNVKTTIHNKKHQKHRNACPTINFPPKYNSFGLSGHLQTAIELKNRFSYVKKYARCDYTNVTCS